MLIDGDENLEILVVQVELGDQTCRLINAYGPKEGLSKSEFTLAFYNKLDLEIKNAKLFGHMVCLQFDANAKLGCQIIKGDPYEMSANGEHLFQLISRNNLIVCNASEKCQGSITRQRVTTKGEERSILDFFIVCEDMYLNFYSMQIDDCNVLTRYSKKKDKIVVTKSDHNMLICEFTTIWSSRDLSKNENREIFNFKSQEGLNKYKYLTSKTTLQDCFKGGNIIDESRVWFKQFNNILHRSFPKIKLKNKPKQRNSLLHEKMYIKSLFNCAINVVKGLEIKNDIKISELFKLQQEVTKLDIFIANY